MIHVKSNYHTHTSRCGHAFGSDIDYVEAAIKMGYDLLGFSDHVMLPWQINDGGVRAGFYRLEEYQKTIRLLQKQYKGKIDILVGFECEYDDKFKRYYEYLINNNIVDYLVLGNHFTSYNIENTSFETIFYDEHTSKEKVIFYLDNAIKAIQTGLFKIFAHPDYFMATFDDFDEDIKKKTIQLIKSAKEFDVALEINQSQWNNGAAKVTFPNGTRYRFPYKPFWELVAQVKGVKVVTGIDAHKPEAFNNTNGRVMAFEFANDCGLTIVEDLMIQPKDLKEFKNFRQNQD